MATNRFCRVCGAKAIGDDRFCRDCGETLPVDSSPADPVPSSADTVAGRGEANPPTTIASSPEGRKDHQAGRLRTRSVVGVVAIGMACVLGGAAAFLLLGRDGGTSSSSDELAAVAAPVRNAASSLQVAVDGVRDREDYLAVKRSSSRLAAVTRTARRMLAPLGDDATTVRFDSALRAVGDYGRTLAVVAATPSGAALAAAKDARTGALQAFSSLRVADAELADRVSVPLPALTPLLAAERRFKAKQKAEARARARAEREAEQTGRKVAPGPRKVGVPSTYEGHFTSVDRLQRCYAQGGEAWCTSGPSGQRVKLVAGQGAFDQGKPGSRDVGGGSMPMGTRFTTKSGAITCESSRRGITCRDSAGRGFVIGDMKLFTFTGREPSPSPPSPSGSVGVPTVYAGSFTSVDRLQRCYANDDVVACSSGPSGQQVALSVGGGASYEGVGGSADNGAPSMPMGTAFTTPGGRVTCDSSSRGITCRDRTTGNGFTIGDRYTIVRNNGVERRY